MNNKKWHKNFIEKHKPYSLIFKIYYHGTDSNKT